MSNLKVTVEIQNSVELHALSTATIQIPAYLCHKIAAINVPYDMINKNILSVWEKEN
jgi:hypothetical protein